MIGLMLSGLKILQKVTIMSNQLISVPFRPENLTFLSNLGYSLSTPPTWDVGTTTSVKNNIKGNTTPFRTGVFLCLSYSVMAGLTLSHFGGRASFEARGSNSVYRLATLITTQLCKSPINSKETS